jgi:hypothetical protein
VRCARRSHRDGVPSDDDDDDDDDEDDESARRCAGPGLVAPRIRRPPGELHATTEPITPVPAGAIHSTR